MNSYLKDTIEKLGIVTETPLLISTDDDYFIARKEHDRLMNLVQCDLDNLECCYKDLDIQDSLKSIVSELNEKGISVENTDLNEFVNIIKKHTKLTITNEDFVTLGIITLLIIIIGIMVAISKASAVKEAKIAYVKRSSIEIDKNFNNIFSNILEELTKPKEHSKLTIEIKHLPKFMADIESNFEFSNIKILRKSIDGIISTTHLANDRAVYLNTITALTINNIDTVLTDIIILDDSEDNNDIDSFNKKIALIKGETKTSEFIKDELTKHLQQASGLSTTNIDELEKNFHVVNCYKKTEMELSTIKNSHSDFTAIIDILKIALDKQSNFETNFAKVIKSQKTGLTKIKNHFESSMRKAEDSKNLIVLNRLKLLDKKSKPILKDLEKQMIDIYKFNNHAFKVLLEIHQFLKHMESTLSSYFE